MQYRVLGSSGVALSVLSLGTAFYGSTTPVDVAIELIHHALDHGINALDTANTYGDHRFDYPGVPRPRPLVEEIVGQAIKGRRSSVFLATKCGESVGSHPNQRGLSRRHIMEQVELSLRRLGTDYIDLYYPHHPDPTTPISETLRAFDDLVHQGKVRSIGLSDYRAWQVVEALWMADRLRLSPPVCVQTLYNLLDRRDEFDLLPVCQRYGLSLVVFSPLAGGLLSGIYHPGEPPPSGSRAAFTQAPSGRPAAIPVLQPSYLERAQRFASFAREHGYSPSVLALAWLLSHPEITSVITGASTIAELDENSRATTLTLSSEERATLDALLPPHEFPPSASSK